jgi:hypothetical protein
MCVIEAAKCNAVASSKMELNIKKHETFHTERESKTINICQEPISCRWKIANFRCLRSRHRREITLHIYRPAKIILNLNTYVTCICEESDEDGLECSGANQGVHRNAILPIPRRFRCTSYSLDFSPSIPTRLLSPV